MRSMIAVLSLFMLLLVSPATAQVSVSSTGATEVTAALAAQAGVGGSTQPVVLTDSASASASSEIDPATVMKLVLDALSGKNWALLACAGVLLAVYLARRVGAPFWPWLSSDLGGVSLSFVTAVAFALASALSSGQPLTFSMLLGAVLAAAGASGFWSWGKKINAAIEGNVAPSPKTPQEAAVVLSQTPHNTDGSN